MKMNLAIYTAQEGYAWQPGTALPTDDLVRFKKCIGKFPSPDSMDFPFGGIFLLDDRVVFYRYHVAKKIDFRGRDALYCVLGVVSREEAAKIDPAALFAYPEFAGPMKPFPVSLDVPEADPVAVPEWLKNLGQMTLDVRITGTTEKPSYAVVQNPIEAPRPPDEAPPANDSAKVTPPGQVQTPETQAPLPPSVSTEPETTTPPEPEQKEPRWLFWSVIGFVALAVILSVALCLCLRGCATDQQTGSADGQTNAPPIKAVSGSGTNELDVMTNLPETVTNAPAAVTNAPVAVTNLKGSVTNTSTVATNASKAVTNVLKSVKAATPPPPASPKPIVPKKTTNSKATSVQGKKPVSKNQGQAKEKDKRR